jgi:hypothetical protein
LHRAMRGEGWNETAVTNTTLFLMVLVTAVSLHPRRRPRRPACKQLDLQVETPNEKPFRPT